MPVAHAAAPADWVRGVGLSPDSVSIVVMDPLGNVRVDWQADQPRQLGSVMKLVTTLSAIELLGPEKRFSTELLAVPVPHSKKWRLFFRGAGDIELKMEDLKSLIDAAKEQGVAEIASPITVDLRRFDAQKSEFSGISLTPNRASGLAPAPLTVNFGLIELSVDEQGAWQLTPPFRWARTSEGPVKTCPSDWAERLDFQPDAKRYQFRITTPSLVSCGPALIRRAPLSQLAQFEWATVLLWPETAHLPWKVGEAPSYAPVAVRHDSLPLRDWVRDINTFSNNVAARTLLLQIAADQGDVPARPEDGIQRVRQWLRARDWVFPEFDMENGAGLSHRETLSARHLSTILKYALTSNHVADFTGSLAIPGEEGTLRYRLSTLTGRTQWRLKTGYLDGVRTLAGYYFSPEGPWVVVCLVNDPAPDRAFKLQEVLLSRIEAKDFDTNTEAQRQPTSPHREIMTQNR
jgi:D-alanyl-D-alanine carboxypeptidase/D-alanyl-D-alanine-endopeptidase (penicillin-binding protein 4)